MHSNVKMSARICMFGSDDLDLFRVRKSSLWSARNIAGHYIPQKGRSNLKSTPYAIETANNKIAEDELIEFN